MQAPDPIETVLARLMPPALSQDCQNGLEAMIDDLAGPAEVIPRISTIRQSGRWVLGGGIAAAVGALCAVLPVNQEGPPPPSLAGVEAPPSGLVLLSESDRVESMTDEGWWEDADGSALRAMRLKVVGENQVRDEESGMKVRISEPREEVLFVPISSF